jgi:hypothetical protein
MAEFTRLDEGNFKILRGWGGFFYGGSTGYPLYLFYCFDLALFEDGHHPRLRMTAGKLAAAGYEAIKKDVASIRAASSNYQH